MKYILTKINFGLVATNIVFLALLFVPILSHAMNIEIERPYGDIKPGDTVIMHVLLDSGETEINAIDGSIDIKGDFEIESLLTAGSIFDLWQTKPTYNNGRITFVGGSTAGMFGTSMKLFSMAVKVNSSSPLVFSSANTSAFLNDGSGTKVGVDALNQMVVVENRERENRNDLEVFFKKDTKSPEPFDIVITRSPDVFDGKYFASFFALDRDSGIEVYVVTEKGFDPVESTNNTYVLQNQKGNGKLNVKAVDAAGNDRVVEVEYKDGVVKNVDTINWFAVFIGILIVFILFFVWNFFKRKNAFIRS